MGMMQNEQWQDKELQSWFKSSFDNLKKEVRNEVKELLKDLKSEIIVEVRQLLRDREQGKVSRWLKSAQVKKMLDLSHGKLQMMRDTKTIPFSRIGGTIYYNADDIERMMEERSV